jgi:tetratricopeptide (TPR) repeat protein
VKHDYLGNPVSGDDASTLAAIDDFVGGMLGYEERMLGIIAAADRDPESCLANAYAGWLWMFLESPDAPARAAPYLARAMRAAPGATHREQLATEVLAAWSVDDIAAAARRADHILAIAPRDLAALKLHQYFSFTRGQFPEMLRVALNALPGAGDVAQLHGMVAFAYEQCHLLADAESAARTGLRMQARDPWAQHALAHVLLSRGRIREGMGFLEGASGSWVGLTSFMDTHLWWHLALFLISEGRFDAALDVYDRHCWARDRSYSQDQVGAVSLLARIELAGQAVGPRWKEIGEHLMARSADTVQPFLTLQYLYGLGRAHRHEADKLLAAVRERAGSGPDGSRALWSNVVLPACEALLAYVRGDYDAAHSRLGPVMPRMLEVGGSHAQRDLFAQVYVDALLKSGQHFAAQQLLEERRRFEPDGVPVNRALAQLYTALGLPGEASRATARARRAPG